MSGFGTRKGTPFEPLGTEHGAVQRVASQLGYGTESVRSWFAQADVATCGRSSSKRRGFVHPCQVGGRSPNKLAANLPSFQKSPFLQSRKSERAVSLLTS